MTRPVLPEPAAEAAARPLEASRHIEQFLLYRLHNLGRLGASGVALRFRREVGISRRDWRVLAFVARYPQTSLAHLAQVAELGMAVASRCVTRLVEQRLIVRRRLPDNKRFAVLSLTDEGQRTYERALQCGQRYDREFTSCLSEQEARMLDELLGRLHQRARELTQEELARGGAGLVPDELD